MDLPNRLLKHSEVRELDDSEDTVVPYFIRDDDTQRYTYAFFHYSPSDNEFNVKYYEPQQSEWKVLGSIQPEEVKFDYEKLYSQDIHIIGDGAREAYDLHYSLGEKFSSRLDEPLFMYSKESTEILNGKTPVSKCDCSASDFEKLQIVQFPVSEGDPVPLITCSKCDMPYYIGTGPENKVSINKATSVDWVHDETTTKSEVESDRLRFIVPDYSESVRSQYVIGALVAEVQAENRIATDIHHGIDEYMFVIRSGEIIGLVSWNQRWEIPTLQQVYLRPEYRGNGYGQETVKVWTDWIDGNEAYSDQMNEASRAIFDNLGLWEDGEDEFLMKEFTDIYPQGVGIDKEIYELFSSSIPK